MTATNPALNPNIIELVNEDGSLEWTGSTEQFIDDNAEFPLSDDEMDHLLAKGYVVVGGGAQPIFTVRFGLAVNDETENEKKIWIRYDTARSIYERNTINRTHNAIDDAEYFAARKAWDEVSS